MLLPNRLYPGLSQKVISDLTRIIDDNLLRDWLISIEYTDEVRSLNTEWVRWGGVFLNVDGSIEVIKNIFFCHINNPSCAMRLNAVRHRMKTRFYYPICDMNQNNKNYSVKTLGDK